ncbi:MAG TPA: type II secretion system F family protein [Candidatus Saccharimonadales bacterium]|jgi:type IV pilus assembly protein PilC|nr:type II secretion system F family protein [Candidatus Saccharimonadales bacterium]
MKRFNYKAKDSLGRVVTGEVEAPDIHQAARLVKGKSLYVISITAKIDSPFSIIRRLRERITPSDVSTFTRQLSTMINAGLPITEALLILRSQSKGSMQKIVAQILADVEAGDSFSNSLSRHPKIFSRTFIALVKSGEVGGVMDAVLLRLADDLEKQQEFGSRVKGALIYPAIIVVGMVIVSFVMMIFVIPRLLSLYKDFNATLPLPTLILIGISNFFINYWYIMIAVFGLGFYVFNLFKATPEGRRKIDALTFKIPVFGDLQRQIILTQLTRTLSLMVGAGVPILEALNITSEVVGNTIISDALKDAAKQVERGFPIAFSFARHPEAFPFILSQMVAVGEETGKMDDVLTKISHIFEVDSDEKVKGLTAAIEPIVMVILGLGVGFLVIAVILPIYNLTNQF